MRLLNADLIIKHINEKLMGYELRKNTAFAAKDMQSVCDYNIRIMVLNNLMIRVARGEFDYFTVKKEVEIQKQSEGTSEVKIDET